MVPPARKNQGTAGTTPAVPDSLMPGQVLALARIEHGGMHRAAELRALQDVLHVLGIDHPVVEQPESGIPQAVDDLAHADPVGESERRRNSTDQPQLTLEISSQLTATLVATQNVMSPRQRGNSDLELAEQVAG